MSYRQEAGLIMMADICREGNFANSTEYNNALNEILKTLIATSDDFKAGRADAYELCSKLRMFKLLQDRFFRGVP